MNSSPPFSFFPHDFKVHAVISMIKSHLYNYSIICFKDIFKEKIKKIKNPTQNNRWIGNMNNFLFALIIPVTI